MDVTWELGALVAILIAGILIFTVLAIKREGNRTRLFRVGFFVERERYDEKKGGEDDLRDE